MSNLLKDIYDKAEGIKGKKLFYTILITFVLFILIGILIGYTIPPKLTDDENFDIEEYLTEVKDPGMMEASGRIVSVPDGLYPMDDDLFSLVDYSGNELYLLRADDDTLMVAEGLFVTVTGKMDELNDGQTKVLVVEEVVIQSNAD